MARRDGDIAGGLISGAILLAVLLAAGIGILLWAMLSELWHIYATTGRTGSDGARKILKYALAALIGVFVVSGLLATQPDTAPIGLFTACWATMAYTITCIVTDRRERQKQLPVVMPAALSLDEVVSWRPAADSTMQGMNNRSNTV
jgi:hypothetical protein